MLGVSREASADEIRKASRKLAKENHPDTKPDDKAAEKKFKEIHVAALGGTHSVQVQRNRKPSQVSNPPSTNSPI